MFALQLRRRGYHSVQVSVPSSERPTQWASHAIQRAVASWSSAQAVDRNESETAPGTSSLPLAVLRGTLTAWDARFSAWPAIDLSTKTTKSKIKTRKSKIPTVSPPTLAQTESTSQSRNQRHL